MKLFGYETKYRGSNTVEAIIWPISLGLLYRQKRGRLVASCGVYCLKFVIKSVKWDMMQLDISQTCCKMLKLNIKLVDKKS